jgi:hypothetical protein
VVRRFLSRARNTDFSLFHLFCFTKFLSPSVAIGNLHKPKRTAACSVGHACAIYISLTI